ncbi:MAG: DUF1624 domain-containing protein, partial [bacterium]|nr:DUF1624 domain-containing protein [Candidatus Kapabacteria bacterium]
MRALDRYRGVAVLLMISAHACDAFLAESWKRDTAWYALDILFGFVAPAFLFLSGATLAISLARSHRRPPLQNATSDIAHRNGDSDAPRVQLRRCKRLVFILLLAYWLQIPILSLRQLIWNQRPQELARLFDSNVLHVVAVGGLLCVVVDALFAPRRARVLATILATAIVIATSYVSSTATFPLLPYIAYVLAGYASIAIIVPSSARRLLQLIVAGALMIVVSITSHYLLSSMHVHSDFWHGS